jgi:hypothetical protein
MPLLRRTVYTGGRLARASELSSRAWISPVLASSGVLPGTDLLFALHLARSTVSTPFPEVCSLPSPWHASRMGENDPA